MYRYSVLIIMLLLLFCGCATYDKSYSYADYQRSFVNDMVFYSQYEIIYKQQTKDGYKLVVAPFLADSNNYLPNEVVKLHLGLSVINPNREKFVIWVDYQFVGIDDNDEFVRKTKLVHKSEQGLPEEFISIDMPYHTNVHSQIHFKIEVFNSKGMLYKSTEALYKIKGVEIKPI